VLNSNMIDLFVKKGRRGHGSLRGEDGLGRQTLYTAIGQLVTHSASGNGAASKFLIVPDDEEIPDDFGLAIKCLGIQVHKFRLIGAKSKRGDRASVDCLSSKG
jgi:hypothetical protein